MTAIAFTTAGCRLNQAETAEIAASFRACGFQIVSPVRACDVCVVNGCAVTAAAERDSLRRARTLRRRHPHAMIVVAGCVAEQILQSGSSADSVDVDLWVGQSQKPRLAAIVARMLGRSYSTKAERSSEQAVDGWRAGGRVRALLKIQDGCSFRCAYCIVPRLRPRTYSRPINRIVAAAGRLAADGCREIVLTGTNLGCYNYRGKRLPELLQELSAIPDGPRIRLSSIEITTVERGIIDVMAASERICRYLHFPLQSGDDAVLRRMGRRYSVADYCQLIVRAQRKLPVFGLGADIIVGFPGETDEAFENTVRVIRELPFSNLHVFPFSPRPGTAAAELDGTVAPSVKKERARRLALLNAEKKVVFAAQQVGRPVTVLLERVQHGEATGRTGEYLAALVRGRGLKANCFFKAPVSFNDNGTVVLQTNGERANDGRLKSGNHCLHGAAAQ